ncbi:hypothetical protein H4Q26_012113 [Puccinia striiformis f. sp. tritici PST-130]|nr:hypothetical protein H4Q26_012113 [Puccinia striiformis f. sp. tritici PST-130]
MAINEHPPPREELSTTEDEDNGAVEYHNELPTTDDGEITRAAKKQAISAKLPTASVAPPLGPPLPHTSSTPVKITPSTSPSDIIVGEKDKARLVGKILQGQQSGRLKMLADHQFQMEGCDHPTAKLSRSAGSASLARARKTPATITRDFGQLVRDGPSNTQALTNYKSPNLRSDHRTRKTNPTPTDRLQPSLVLTCLGMRNHSERQMVIRDLGLIIVWLDSQDSDLMVESAIGIRALPTISQLAFPRSPMLQKTFDTLFSEEAEAMDLLQQVLSHRYLEARRPPKSRGEYDLQLLFNMSDYDF